MAHPGRAPGERGGRSPHGAERSRACGGHGRRRTPARRDRVRPGARRVDRRGRIPETAVKILHLVSCRGWSSDAYWAARATHELVRRGHEVTLGCRAGTEQRVVDRAREEGVTRTEMFGFVGGLKPRSDIDDVRQIAGALATTDVVHVHRGKEHWLAAVANRLSSTPRPLVRTRHIVQAVRSHAANRWLYRSATALVITVSDAIRRQYLAAGLIAPERIVTLAGGADAERYRPGLADEAVRKQLGGRPGVALVGLVSGFRVMKGH